MSECLDVERLITVPFDPLFNVEINFEEFVKREDLPRKEYLLKILRGQYKRIYPYVAEDVIKQYLSFVWNTWVADLKKAIYEISKLPLCMLDKIINIIMHLHQDEILQLFNNWINGFLTHNTAKQEFQEFMINKIREYLEKSDAIMDRMILLPVPSNVCVSIAYEVETHKKREYDRYTRRWTTITYIWFSSGTREYVSKIAIFSPIYTIPRFVFLIDGHIAVKISSKIGTAWDYIRTKFTSIDEMMETLDTVRKYVDFLEEISRQYMHLERESEIRNAMLNNPNVVSVVIELQRLLKKLAIINNYDRISKETPK